MPVPKKLIRVAWMAIVLGVMMEVLVLVSGGARNAILRDTLSKVAWSSIVCFGVAAGAAASAKLKISAMGVAGLFAAPAAFMAARVVHKAFTFAAVTGAGERPGTVLLVALMKAAEYGAFGLFTGWLAGERFHRGWHYATAGAFVGLYFGVLIATVTTAGNGANRVPMMVNEIIFPVGCALVLFAARLLTTEEVPAAAG